MIGMPKPKPTSIIRHEISFSRPVQDSFDTLVYGITANRIATPFIELIKDNTAMAAILALFGLWIGYDFLLDDEPDSQQIARAWLEYKDSEAYRIRYRDRAGSLFGGIINLIENVFAPIAGALDPETFFEDAAFTPPPDEPQP